MNSSYFLKKNFRRWLAALAAERRLVLTDRQEGLELTPAARHLARAQAQVRGEEPNELIERGGRYFRTTGEVLNFPSRINSQDTG